MATDWSRLSAGALAGVVAAAVLAIIHGDLAMERPLRDRMAALETHTRASAAAQIALFDQVDAMNRAAVERFHHTLDARGREELLQQYYAYFPEIGDGTRRSVPGLFDGLTEADGTRIEGVGAFIGNAGQMSPEQEYWFSAGFRALVEVGPDFVEPGSSLYYFTPDRRMVMYGPYRSDRLEFYRFDAPADFNLRADEDPILFGAETNPARELQCTALSHYLTVESGPRSAMACRIPVWDGDTLLGAFGSSFEITAQLVATVATPPERGTIWLVDAGGQVISRHESEADAAHEHRLPAMIEMLDPALDFDSFRADNAIIAFVRIPHANWTLLTCVRIDDLVAQIRARCFMVFISFSVIFTLLAAFLSGALPLGGMRPSAKPKAAPAPPAE